MSQTTYVVSLSSPSSGVLFTPGLTPAERAVLYARYNLSSHAGADKKFTIYFWVDQEKRWVLTPDFRNIQSPAVVFASTPEASGELFSGETPPLWRKNSEVFSFGADAILLDGTMANESTVTSQLKLAEVDGLSDRLGQNRTMPRLAAALMGPHGKELAQLASTKLTGTSIAFLMGQTPAGKPSVTGLGLTHGHQGSVTPRSCLVMYRNGRRVAWGFGSYGFSDMFQAGGVLLGLPTYSACRVAPGICVRLSTREIRSDDYSVAETGPPPEVRVSQEFFTQAYFLWLVSKGPLPPENRRTPYCAKEDLEFMRFFLPLVEEVMGRKVERGSISYSTSWGADVFPRDREDWLLGRLRSLPTPPPVAESTLRVGDLFPEDETLPPGWAYIGPHRLRRLRDNCEFTYTEKEPSFAEFNLRFRGKRIATDGVVKHFGEVGQLVLHKTADAALRNAVSGVTTEMEN